MEGKAQKVIFQEQHLVVPWYVTHKLWCAEREIRGREYVGKGGWDPRHRDFHHKYVVLGLKNSPDRNDRGRMGLDEL